MGAQSFGGFRGTTSLGLGFVSLAVSVFGVPGGDFVRLLWSFAIERAKQDNPSSQPSLDSAGDSPDPDISDRLVARSRSRHPCEVKLKLGAGRLHGSMLIPHVSQPYLVPPIRRPSSGDTSLHAPRPRGF